MTMLTDDVAARKSYRYVRIGMIAAVVLLGASVLIERGKAPGCWQTSISAYYYTPVQAIFVGALLAIGLNLIVIKGNTSWEDVCLNVAGALAPIVALVPTSGHGVCWSIPPNPLPTDNGKLAPWVRANIDNNIEALLIAAVFGLVVAAVIAAIAFAVGKRRGKDQVVSNAWKDEHRGTLLSLLVASVFLGLGALAFFSHRNDFYARAHGYAAMAMFAMLALAAGFNAWDCWRSKRRWYLRLYLGVAVLMVAAALLVLRKSWNHRVLWVEAIEIALFATFWIIQTRELWHNTLRSSPEANPNSRTEADQVATVRHSLAVIVTVVGIGMAALTGFGVLNPNETLTVTGVALVAAALGATLWDSRWLRPLLSHVKTLKIASFQIEVDTLIAKVARQTDEEVDETEGSASQAAKAGRIDELRLDLERKLTFVAKNLLPENESAITGKRALPYATIGSLHDDGYLSHDQALLAMQIQTVSQSDLLELAPPSQADFFRVGTSFVKNFPFYVFSAVVCTALKRHVDEDPKPVKNSTGARRVALRQGRGSLLVWPTLASAPDSSLAKRAAKKAMDAAGPNEHVVVVVPNGSKLRGLTPTTAERAVVKLKDLKEVIAIANGSEADLRQPAAPRGAGGARPRDRAPIEG